MAIHELVNSLEKGLGKKVILTATVLAAAAFVGFLSYLFEFGGFEDSASMDNGQLARSLAEGRGYTTSIVRPNTLAQLRRHYTQQGRPAKDVNIQRFPEVSRAPAYPMALSLLYRLPFIAFDQEPTDILKQGYWPEFFTTVFNQLIIAATALILLVLGVRMFDWRVGWTTVVIFIGTSLIWQFSLTALPTNLLFFLMAALFLCLEEAIVADETDRAVRVWLLLPASSVFMALVIYTQYYLAWLLIPYGLFLLVAFRYRLFPAIVAMLLALVLVAPWGYFLYEKTGNPVGSNLQLVLTQVGEEQVDVEKNYFMVQGGRVRLLLRKIMEGAGYSIENVYRLAGSSVAVVLYVVSFLHAFRRRRVLLLRLLILGFLAFSIFGAVLFDPTPLPLSELNAFAPYISLMAMYGTAMFFILLDRTGIHLRMVRYLILTVFLLVNVAPLAVKLLPPNNTQMRYPPYHPPMLRYIQRAVEPNELLMTDMPWATAWYTNRVSLLKPKTLQQFYDIHEGHYPVKAMLLTPITWEASLLEIDKGKLEDWSVLIKREGIPEKFPLIFPVALPPNEDEYLFFSDENRWQSR
ncbi:MAG: hypothetical protein AAGK14_14075 [Verrucomicrobiota bacterium]